MVREGPRQVGHRPGLSTSCLDRQRTRRRLAPRACPDARWPGSWCEHSVRAAHLAWLDPFGQRRTGLLCADRPQGRAPRPAVAAVDLRGGDADPGVRDAPGRRRRTRRPGGRGPAGGAGARCGRVSRSTAAICSRTRSRDSSSHVSRTRRRSRSGGRSRIPQAASAPADRSPAVSRRNSTRAAGTTPPTSTTRGASKRGSTGGAGGGAARWRGRGVPRRGRGRWRATPAGLRSGQGEGEAVHPLIRSHVRIWGPAGGGVSARPECGGSRATDSETAALRISRHGPPVPRAAG